MAAATGHLMNKLAILLLVVSAPVPAETWLCATRDINTGYEYNFTLRPGIFSTEIQAQQVPQPKPRSLTRVMPHPSHTYDQVSEDHEQSFGTSVYHQLQWSGSHQVQYARWGHRNFQKFFFVGQGHCQRIE